MDGIITVDVEDWFNILDAKAAPPMAEWDSLPIWFQRPLEELFELFAKTRVKATFFWLAWFAERFPSLVERCVALGHEVASHGYGHLLAYKTGRAKYRDDLRKSRDVLEQITQRPVHGFRAAGFSTTEETDWFFDEVAKAGYRYDSSVFPATRGHGGLKGAPLEPHVIETTAGPVVEFPQTMLESGGCRFSVFGGGYLRLAPLAMLKWATRILSKTGRPLIAYVHPREIAPSHPRLPLPLVRRFKCYVGLKTTYRKVAWLCENLKTTTMFEQSERLCSTHRLSRAA
jgi:polysaccharide deacetylase family protein (PEP-CTERM system associated)